MADSHGIRIRRPPQLLQVTTGDLVI
uniref:Uncharacterized protein n=1 Tax=Anguilla anguilla TaxID=7936 RepID=A0A0E9SGQ0_ANGAN